MLSSPASVNHARDLVNQIVQQNGFVSEKSLGSMPQDARREVEEALLAKDKKIGASVLTLAKNLYTSNARFVYELLQNTDDNQYTAAHAAGQDPFVSFKLYHDRLVVDCNEDGFTEANLRALCDIGNSSKSSCQGYIGEKGIGFKSVFMAAWKVYIQSGYLSFCFVHRKEDSGMGMVNPIWEDTGEALPQLHHTRITLFLHESKDAEQARRDKGNIRSELLELDPEVLLFVRKLKRIEFFLYDDHGDQEWATRLTRGKGTEASRVCIELRVGDDGESMDDVTPIRYTYHVTEHTATNISRHENRSIPASAETNESKIILAFPVTEASFPVIEPQTVFAFLPMKRMGFNFLIQADFVTQANREDVVTTSQRNKDLIRGVIDAFIKTIRLFCNHRDLQYTWMRFLPREGTHHWDPFWKALVDGIKERLKKEKVIRTRGEGALRRIGEMRDLPSDYIDQRRNPLLPDLDPEIYLSASYARNDISILRDFGLRILNMGDVVDCAKRDLSEAGTRSRLRSNTDDDWQTRISALLLSPFLKGWQEKAEIRRLKIIPLEDGSWVCAVNGDIYYPSIGDIQIPKGTPLKMVTRSSVGNAKRRELFENLGVKSADACVVRGLILGRYSQEAAPDIDVNTSRSHLEFLYLTHGSGYGVEYRHNLRIYDDLGRKWCPRANVFYIQDDQPYGAHNLLGPEGISSVGALLLNRKYVENPPVPPSNMPLSWLGWMYEYVGVRRHLSLVTSDGKYLSMECKHVVNNHSRKFFSFLKHAWQAEGDALEANEDVLAELKSIRVRCKLPVTKPLSECYLPLLELRAVRQKFARKEIVPFLETPSLDDASLLSQWSFLTSFLGVRYEDDLEFRMTLLSNFSFSFGSTISILEVSKLLGLYRYIEEYCAAAQDPDAMRDRVRERFHDEKCILAPSSQECRVDSDWVKPEACLWQAPSSMTTKRPLKALYRKAGIQIESASVQDFLQHTLLVPDISHVNIIEELQATKRGLVERRKVHELYRLLQKVCQVEKDIIAAIRETFEEFGLVYVEQQECPKWHRPSECLWSGTTSIDGKVAINDQYPELKSFFTKVLGVPRINSNMVYHSLLAAESDGASIERVKELLLAFNSLLIADPTPPDPGYLLWGQTFPVRSPGEDTSHLCSAEMDFVIVDQDDLFQVFRTRVRYLDFSLQEVCRLRPFIAWAGLKARYLSRCIQEVSRVQGGAGWPIRDPNRDVKNKAYALLRIAAKYDSPKFNADPQRLYDILRGTATVEAEGISSRLVIRQDGYDREHEVSSSDLHVEEQNEMLNVYVPRDPDDWDTCFLHALPRRLLCWMMTPHGSTETSTKVFDEAAVSAVMSILSCGVSAVPKLLKKHGVPEISEVTEIITPPSEVRLPVTEVRHGPSSDPTESEGQFPIVEVRENLQRTSEFYDEPRRIVEERWESTVASNTPGLTPISNASGIRAPATTTMLSSQDADFSPDSTPEPRLTPDSDEDEGYATPPTHSQPPASDPVGGHERRAPPALELPVIHQETEKEKYGRLLESVVAMAQRMARHEHSSENVQAEVDSLSLHDDDVFVDTVNAHFLSRAPDRHVKIGAAGELFVFELLSNVQPALPFFGCDNWQSTIRHHATGHPRYKNLMRFKGRETSDIVYHDAEGVLTEFLVNKGHLSRNLWAGRTPKYYIEVKSTLDSCNTPFFVSEDQLERMRRITNGPTAVENQHEVYVIFRVFNLGKQLAGLRIYVDPEEQRRTGKLRFMTERYTVVPGAVA